MNETSAREAGESMAAASGKRRCSWRRRIAFGIPLAFGVLAAAYIAFGVYLASGEPQPSVDYLGKVNAAATSVPEGNRAWPLYREAILSLGVSKRENLAGTIDERPGHAGWTALEAFVLDHQDALAKARRGASKPGMGLLLKPAHAYSEADRRAMGLDRARSTSSRSGDGPPALVDALPRHADPMGTLAEWLAADAVVAADRGDGQRVLADVRALLQMAEHMREHPLTVPMLAGVMIEQAALQAIQRVIAKHGEALDTDQLRRLFDLVVDARQRRAMTLKGERYLFYDRIQRLYTDDGSGGGHITGEGLDSIMRISESGEPDSFQNRAKAVVMLPLAVMTIADRREMVRQFDVLMDRAEQALGRPYSEQADSGVSEAVRQLASNRLSKLKYLHLTLLTPATEALRTIVESRRGALDGAMVGLALELHRRKAGAYPANLGALTPGLLPSLPRDRITGNPLRYRLVRGRPVVYSAGWDGDDDIGRTGTCCNGQTEPRAALRERDADGDWILWGFEMVAANNADE